VNLETPINKPNLPSDFSRSTVEGAALDGAFEGAIQRLDGSDSANL